MKAGPIGAEQQASRKTRPYKCPGTVRQTRHLQVPHQSRFALTPCSATEIARTAERTSSSDPSFPVMAKTVPRGLPARS